MKQQTMADILPNKMYLLTPEEIEDIIKVALTEAQSAAHWGEGIDMGVLRVRVARVVDPALMEQRRKALADRLFGVNVGPPKACEAPAGTPQGLE